MVRPFDFADFPGFPRDIAGILLVISNINF
jgi:hypothetical protein